MKYKKIILLAEPNSKGFYLKMGGKLVAQPQTQQKERQLAVFEFEID